MPSRVEMMVKTSEKKPEKSAVGTPQVGFVSLGCAKATVDSERILTRLRAEGYGISPSYEGADLVVVNTCGFIDAAIEESLDAIGEALAANGRVIVTGCLGADAGRVRAAHPAVLAVTGPQACDEVMSAVHEALPAPHEFRETLVPPQGVRLTPRHYAWLKISEGCDHRCTFCIIPQLRGPLASRPVGEVMDEAERLVTAGVREIVVVAQDTAAYGQDIRHRTGFWNGRPMKTRIRELAEALGDLGVWIRLMYVYPYASVDALVELMAEGRVLPYLDVPLQHASPKILRAMRRPAAAEKMLDRIRAWRDVCPEIVLRSTFITGFPGETGDDFERLLDFLREAELDRVGCFPYSPVEGAEANALPGAVPEGLRNERAERLMAVQAGISAARLAGRVGTVVEALVEAVEGDMAVARSWGEAPEVDGAIHIEGSEGLSPGDLVEVRITASDEHDLQGIRP